MTTPGSSTILHTLTPLFKRLNNLSPLMVCTTPTSFLIRYTEQPWFVFHFQIQPSPCGITVSAVLGLSNHCLIEAIFGWTLRLFSLPIYTVTDWKKSYQHKLTVSDGILSSLSNSTLELASCPQEPLSLSLNFWKQTTVSSVLKEKLLGPITLISNV